MNTNQPMSYQKNLPSDYESSLVFLAHMERFDRAAAGDFSLEQTSVKDNPFSELSIPSAFDCLMDPELHVLLLSTNEFGIPDYYLDWIHAEDDLTKTENTPLSELNPSIHLNPHVEQNNAPSEPLAPILSPSASYDIEEDLAEDLSHEFTAFDDSVFNTQMDTEVAHTDISVNEQKQTDSEAVLTEQKLDQLRNQFIRNTKKQDGIKDKDVSLAIDLLNSLTMSLSANKLKVIEIRACLITHPTVRERLIRLFHAVYNLNTDALATL